MKRHLKYDVTFLVLPYFILLILGIVEVWSSSRYFAYVRYGSSTFFLNKELVFVVIALTATLFMSAIDFRFLKRITPALVVLSFLSLLMLYLGAGERIRGATRWLMLLPGHRLHFEPSQFAILVLLIYIAYFVSKKEQYKDSMRGIMPLATVVGVFFLLIALEPDVGTAFLILITFLIVIYVSGYSTKNIAMLIFPSFIVLGLIIYTHPEKLQRVINFFITKQINFQVKQSLIAIGSGGLFGHGIGAGNYKNLFIPDSYNDFILAGIGEDFGFFGIALVILLLVSIILSIFSVAKKSNDKFGSILAFGIGVTLAIQSIMNLFSVLNLMPPKGITLPFLSYGGTSLIVQGMMIGIVISICRRSCGKQTQASVQPEDI